LPATDVTAFMRATLPPPPARVLEVGAGDGGLCAQLTAAGYDVLAIDPASEVETVRPVALHDLDEPAASFDAACAVVSLHHVQPLDESCRRLGELVRPGGLLVIDEIDVERMDEAAAQWWLDHRDDHDHGAADMIAGLREHLHPLDRMRAALAPWFAVGEPVRGAYLYRWEMPAGVRDEEERLIAAGELPAIGARLVGVRARAGSGAA
jgi:SAM-dependent methyltransferase